MRKLDLNQTATDARIIGYIALSDRPYGEQGIESLPLYESDPHAETVGMQAGAYAPAMTDAALIEHLLGALSHIKHAMSVADAQRIALGAIDLAKRGGK